MLAALFNIDAIAKPLASGDLILTANNRLRKHMLRAFAAQQLHSVWQPPAITPLNHWIGECWSALQDNAYPQTAVLIASPLQRQLLWEQIILASDTGQELLQAEELAKSADAALRNLQLWRLSVEQLNAYENLNTDCFKKWWLDFEQAFKTCGLITAETAQEILLQAFIKGDLPRHTQLYLHGFDDLPPLHRELLSAACETLIELPAMPVAGAQVVRTETLNDQAEIRAAALWSQAQLQQTTNAVIGIIVPNLGQNRTQVERIFTEVFEPLAALPLTPRYTLPFNFSAGIPLATTPLVQTALNLLNLNRKNWELEPLCALLVSPFFSDADSEFVARSLLCERLRKLGQFTISASDLHYHSQKVFSQLGAQSGQQQTGNLATAILSLENDRRAIAGQHSASYWVNLFQRQLQQLGWPGTRRLDSQEYQQVNLWQQLLEDFCALDSANFIFDLNQALKHLRKLAGTTPFQAQTPDSPIQILGALEGAGLQFTHCWVMGLNHRSWPPAPAPNPLLPISLQRQHNMPHASAERELVFARALTDNYRTCAQQIVLSSAHSDGDNELRPSALIRDLPLTPLTSLLVPNKSALENPNLADFEALRSSTESFRSEISNPKISHKKISTAEIFSAEVFNTKAFNHSTAQKNYSLIAASRAIELVHCAKGPALPPTNPHVGGGSNLFKYQAACPFNAFAQLRLGAKQIDEPVLGFSAMERGTILHNALAIAWRTLGNSHALHALSDSDLHTLLTQAIVDSIKPLQQKRPHELGSFYCQLEYERLLRLLTAWMNSEKTRPAFSVMTIEEEQIIHFCGLTLNLRIDRIDQLENNDLLLIDYKTGSPKAKSWLGERPDEPQLLLYAVTHSIAVAAIAFAQINAKALAWIGTGQLGVYHEGINQPAQEWSMQLEEWRSSLQRLAEDFIAGDARVDFKDKSAEQYAEDLLPLNRLAEADAIERLLLEQEYFKAEGNR